MNGELSETNSNICLLFPLLIGAAQGCPGAAQTFKNQRKQAFLRVYGFEGAPAGEGGAVTRITKSSCRRFLLFS